jgi:hypothetical protein
MSCGPLYVNYVFCPLQSHVTGVRYEAAHPTYCSPADLSNTRKSTCVEVEDRAVAGALTLISIAVDPAV